MPENTPDNKDLYILCVDDEPELLNIMKQIVSGLSFTPLTAALPSEAINLVEAHSRNLAMIISDFKMPEMDGFQFRNAIMEKHGTIPFALLSAHITKEMALEGIDRKICAFLEKPASPEIIEEIIRRESPARVTAIRDEKELLHGFYEDASTLMEDLEGLLQSLGDSPTQDTINSIYGIIHTVKGASAFFDSYLNKFSHKYEDIFSQLKKGQLQVTPPVMAVLVKGYDTLTDLVRTVEHPHERSIPIEELLKQLDLNAAPKTENTKKVEGDTTAQPKEVKTEVQARNWLKVPIAQLDAFMELAGQITVIRNMLDKLVRTLDKQYKSDKNISLLNELLEEMHKINGSMQDRMVEIRKYPLKDVYKPFIRLARDLSNNLKKQIQIKTEGDELRVDTVIGDVLGTCLVHLIRNSADHGLESPEERKASNKPETGTVTLSGNVVGENVIVKITDDGRGINPEKIKQKALESRLKTREELELMSNDKILGLIFEAGFSTAQVVTDISGRGVGMDMVKSSIEKLRGTISITSEMGTGSTVTLQLPIPKSVLIVSSLLVDVCSNTFAIPQENILRLIWLKDEEDSRNLKTLGDSEFLLIDEQLIPVVRIDDLMKLNLDSKDRKDLKKNATFVVLSGKEATFAIAVDTILNNEDTVVKPFDHRVPMPEFIAGGTFLGEGKVGLVLNIDSLGSFAGVHKALEKVASKSEKVQLQESRDLSAYLVMKLGCAGLYAVPLDRVFRLERLKLSQVQYSGGHPCFLYRDKVVSIRSATSLFTGIKDAHTESKRDQDINLIVTQKDKEFTGWAVEDIIDIVQSSEKIQSDVRVSPAALGTVTLRDTTVTVISLEDNQ